MFLVLKVFCIWLIVLDAQGERDGLRHDKFLVNFISKEADPPEIHCLIRTLKTHPPVLALLSSLGQKPSFRRQ